MTKADIGATERELELASMMVTDLQKLWNSYAKKALVAKQERERRQEKKGFLEYETEAELIEAWGWEFIDKDTYYRGLTYFESLKEPPPLSVVEEHRKNIKGLLDRWKGTVSELSEELYPVDNVPKESIFDKMAQKEREERYKSMM